MEKGTIIWRVFAVLVAILFFLHLILGLIGSRHSQSENSYKRRNNALNIQHDTLPRGFEEFETCKYKECRYRVWAETPDTVYGFKIRALMVSWIDNDRLDAITILKLKHRSGKVMTIETKHHELLTCEEFRSFVNSNHNSKNDTIVAFNYQYEVSKADIVDMYDYWDRPFIFIDITFDGRKSLLFQKYNTQDYTVYDVYSLGRKGESVNKVTYEPYLTFASSANHWGGGGGTEVNYRNKSITHYSVLENSCSCHINYRVDTYKLNSQRTKFIHTQKKIINH